MRSPHLTVKENFTLDEKKFTLYVRRMKRTNPHAPVNGDVGRALRLSRIAADIQQRKLAQQLGVSAPFLSDVEHGKKLFPLEYYRLLPEPIRSAVREARIRQAEEELAALRRKL